MKCQKMKKYLYFGLSVFMSLYLSLCSCIGSYASESEEENQDDTWTMNAGTFLELAWQGFAREISAPYVVWNTLNGCNYNDFALWMQNGNHYNLLEDGTVTGHGGAGYSRPSDKINNSTQIDVQPELTQYVLNYVQYCTTQTPLGYKTCSLSSYNFIDTSQFSNYNQYATFMQLCKNYPNTYCFVTRRKSGSYYLYHCAFVPKNTEVFFYGTTTQGIFTNVSTGYNWTSTSSIYNQVPNSVKIKINVDGSTTENANLELYTGTCHNGTSVGNSSTECTVFTTMSKNEYIYVFDTIQAFRMYNAGRPQDYYLSSKGVDTANWTASGSGIINTGSMNNSGNYYSSVTNGVGSNWTPDQILALVDKVTSANGGSGGSGDSDKDTSKMWDRIGNAIGNLIDGIISVFTTVIEKLSDALLSVIHLLTGYTDENGIFHEGLFTKLTMLVNSGFSTFISSIFSWLPEEIVTLLTATLVFGIFFGLLKMLRR